MGTRLRLVRHKHGLTLREAADVTGFSVSHLSNVERGVRAATDDVVRAYDSLGESTSETPSSSVAVRFRSSPSRSFSELDDDFGARLLRLRLSRELSLSELSAATHVSKSHLSNLERGRKRASEGIAAACDAFLGANGALVALRSTAVRPSARGFIPMPNGASPEGASAADGADPEEVHALGEASLLGVRHAAQHGQPGPLALTLARRAQFIADAAASDRGPRAERLWLLAARCAEFTGWLAEESGDTAVSRAWTLAAAEWAAAGGDADMGGYRWERLALTPLYQGRAADTVSLANRALLEPGVSPRVRGLATRRLAQGLALAGDRAACERALDDAVVLLARGPSPFPRGPSWGPNTIDDGSAVIRASCLVDLGAHRAAVRALGPDPDVWGPAAAPRTRVRFVVRGALAFAGASELDHACALAESVLPDVSRLDSITVRADLRRLIRILLRHRSHPRSRALLPELIRVTRAD